MQTHLAPRTLLGGRPESDTQALFAVNPSGKAILFIHGFSGQALKTWASFHELLPTCARCSSHDMYFYGYDGLWAELNSSAGIFRGFLRRIFESPSQILTVNLPPSAQRPSDFRYNEIIIVAHSLGAVIARRALLDATDAGWPWVTKTKLVLFAPAHKGAVALNLAFEALGRWNILQAFGVASRFASPLIEQLQPNSSVLAKLLEDTKQAIEGGANPHLTALKVVLAERERIVINESFASDPPPDSIPDTTHSSVCKPSTAFAAPLTILESVL